MSIPGTLSLREAQLEAELETIRKDGATDGADPVRAAEQALDRLAQKAASRSGESFAKAYTGVVRDTPVGQELYALISGKVVIEDPVKTIVHLRGIGH